MPLPAFTKDGDLPVRAHSARLDVTQVTGDARLLFDHASAQTYFGASVFWLRRLALLAEEETAIREWQIKRDGSRRGIIEIVSE